MGFTTTRFCDINNTKEKIAQKHLAGKRVKKATKIFDRIHFGGGWQSFMNYKPSPGKREGQVQIHSIEDRQLQIHVTEDRLQTHVYSLGVFVDQSPSERHQ